MVDNLCHSHLSTKKPGPQASLYASEIITLAIFGKRFSRGSDEWRTS